MANESILERIVNTPKKNGGKCSTNGAVRRSRRLGPSVSIVGDGENEETPVRKILETALQKKTMPQSRFNSARDNEQRSPLIETNDRDFVNVEKAKKKNGAANKGVSVEEEEVVVAVVEAVKERKKKSKKSENDANENSKKSKKKSKKKKKTVEICIEADVEISRDKSEEPSSSSMSIEERIDVTQNNNRNHNKEDEEDEIVISEEDDPMQILKLAVMTWQKLGVDPSEAIFDAFPLRLSERKDGATLRRLMAALAGVDLAPTTVKKAREIRDEMLKEEDDDDDDDDVCDMVEDKDESRAIIQQTTEVVEAAQPLEDHATRRLSFGSGNCEKETTIITTTSTTPTEEEEEEFGTPEGKEEEGDIEGTMEPCDCGELDCPKEKMLKNKGPFQLPQQKFNAVKQRQQLTPAKTWMDEDLPSPVQERVEEDEEDDESVAATDIDDEENSDDEEEDVDASIAGTESYVLTPIITNLVERATLNKEPTPPVMKEEKDDEEEEEEIVAARPRRKAAAKKKVQILSSSDEEEEEYEDDNDSENDADSSNAIVSRRASRRVANKQSEVAEKNANRRRNKILDDDEDEMSEDEMSFESDDNELSEIAEDEDADDDSDFITSDDDDDDDEEDVRKDVLKTAMKTAKTPGMPAKTPGRVMFRTPTPPKSVPNTIFRGMTDKKCNTASRAARLAAMEDENEKDAISPFNLERLETPPNEDNMSPKKTFSAWKPPPSHSKALTSALKSVGKTIGGNLKNGFDFNKHKESITRALFDEFNANVFDRQLPSAFEISWSKKLLTTAGLTHYKRTTVDGVRIFTARIELSTKVLDSVHKLEATLLHEMCHAAAWLVDHVAKPPHGAVFKEWAKKAMNTYPGTNVSTCHAYAIHTPFKWKCTQTWCEQEYGRHSKSIDIEKKRCGLCAGRLEFMGKFTSDGVLVKGSNVEKKPTGFSKFVKENFGDVKKELGAKTPHKKIMEKLSEKWNDNKNDEGISDAYADDFSDDKENNVQKEAPGTISKAAARSTKMALFEDEILTFTEKKKNNKSVSINEDDVVVVEEEAEVETKMKALNLNAMLLNDDDD